MNAKIVVLGGGTGGTLVANRLHRRMGPSDHVWITVVDQDDRHVYQPGLLFVPFGLADPSDLVKSRKAQLLRGIDFREQAVDHVDVAAHTVHLAGGEVLDYDVLVVATGAVLVPEETEGFAPPWPGNLHTFYSLEGASRLAEALERFEKGRLLVNMIDLPIKCPVAPLEFCFLADWYFTERGVRGDVEIAYATPLDGAFTKPVASRTLADLLDEKGIELVTEFNTGSIDAAGGGPGARLVSYDGREVPFDLAVVVPLHSGAPFIGRSAGLGDELGFVAVDPHTLQSTADPSIFAIGDAAGVPTSKAGSVTHFEGEILVENISRHLKGEELDGSFDGHTNCFIETGFHKALLIDFNYDTEPLPGHFPGNVGLPLLKEARLNHLGKLMFQWFYWHGLLPGRDIPGIGPAMPAHGKHREPAA